MAAAEAAATGRRAAAMTARSGPAGPRRGSAYISRASAGTGTLLGESGVCAAAAQVQRDRVCNSVCAGMRPHFVEVSGLLDAERSSGLCSLRSWSVLYTVML